MKKELVIAKRRPSTDRVMPVPRQVMHKRTVIGAAGIALLAACTTPTSHADYAADKKKYDDCVAREKDRVAGAPNPAYYRDTIRNFCGEAPTTPSGEKK